MELEQRKNKLTTGLALLALIQTMAISDLDNTLIMHSLDVM